ncbi:MAG: nitroreductase family protein [Candidatus Methanoplasma sp.]|jgi:nitroreductase|nr:nitroreductase family protein [Candidatus Methanoplasma sp.]
MNEVLNAIYGRASVRSFKPDQVPEETVKELLNAGFHAANGINTQALRFVVVQNKEQINGLSDAAKSIYIEDAEETGESNPFLLQAYKRGGSIFHDAPTVIFIFASPEVATPTEDAALAAGNILLAAHSLGYGGCIIGLADPLESHIEFWEDNNVPEDHIYLTAVAVGKPAGAVAPSPRSEVKVLSWIR